MPSLWNKTIAAHRHDVHEAILNATVALVAKHGLRSVTMSRIAEKTGIGRATLYKYFPGVEEILIAWHESQVAAHLAHLADVRDRAGNASERLEAVLNAYARIAHEHRDNELAALVHRGEHFAQAQQQLGDLFRDLLIDTAQFSGVRDDVAPDELANYCVHALAAASNLPSEAAVRRLVKVILAGMSPPAVP